MEAAVSCRTRSRSSGCNRAANSSPVLTNWPGGRPKTAEQFSSGVMMLVAMSQLQTATPEACSVRLKRSWLWASASRACRSFRMNRNTRNTTVAAETANAPHTTAMMVTRKASNRDSPPRFHFSPFCRSPRHGWGMRTACAREKDSQPPVCGEHLQMVHSVILRSYFEIQSESAPSLFVRCIVWGAERRHGDRRGFRRRQLLGSVTAAGTRPGGLVYGSEY